MINGTCAGNVGKDGELRQVGNDQVLNFSVATDHYDSKTKDRVTEWVGVSMWGKRAAAVAPFIKKGTPVVCIGEITIRRYEHNGERKYEVQCRASDVKLMGGKKDEAGSGTRPHVGATDNDASDDFGGL